MKPVFSKGDNFIGKVSDNFQIGDVVFFTRENKTYVHRLVAKIPFTSWFLEKGDAYNIPGLVYASEIEGKIIYPTVKIQISLLNRIKYIFRWLIELILGYFR